MRFLVVFPALALVFQAGNLQAQDSVEPAPKVLSTPSDSVAYAFGMAIGDDLKRTGIEYLDADMLVKAITAIYTDQRRELTEEQQRSLITKAMTEANEKRNSAAVNAAREFMEANKSKPGIMITASGLQYEIIREGNGSRPSSLDTVTVHYRGLLADGNQFDSSYDRGEPTTFPLNRVIAGWQEGLQLMPSGAHYRFYIPYELGYGERGSGGMIPPFSPLVFDVELINIGSADETP